MTDGDNRAALAVTRSLGRLRHQIIVAEKRQPSLAQSSRYCAGSVQYPDPFRDPAAFIETLAAAVRDQDFEFRVHQQIHDQTDDEERQKITVQSFVKINQAHTFEHRAQEILVTSGVTHAQSPARRRRAR